MTYASIYDQIERAAEKAELDFKPNDMRKFFSTNMRTSGINEALIKLWQGHSIGVEEGYYIPDEEHQRKIYEEHYPALALNSAAVIFGSDNVIFWIFRRRRKALSFIWSGIVLTISCWSRGLSAELLVGHLISEDL